MMSPATVRRADLERPPSSQRGYGGSWPMIRELVLREHGIPESSWTAFDVDHVPRWPTLGEDHSLYTLVPRRHGSHSTITLSETRRGVRAAWRRMEPRPGELFPEIALEQRRPFRWEEWAG